jgi:hypothetical protein
MAHGDGIASTGIVALFGVTFFSLSSVFLCSVVRLLVVSFYSLVLLVMVPGTFLLTLEYSRKEIHLAGGSRLR